MTCFLVFSNVVEADATSMGGTASQEYHYLSEIGEGKLHTCQACNHSVERSDEDNNLNECHKCKSKNLAQRNGIEVFKFSYDIYRFIYSFDYLNFRCIFRAFAIFFKDFINFRCSFAIFIRFLRLIS